jgi:hypothetical protein
MPDNARVIANGVNGVKHWLIDRTLHTACVRRSAAVARQLTLGMFCNTGLLHSPLCQGRMIQCSNVVPFVVTFFESINYYFI